MTFSSYHLPAPADWQAFERFTRDLFSAVWDDPRAQANGRAGQAQAGVDVFGTSSRTGGLEGVQCKGKDARYGNVVTVDELQAEVKKALTFKPALTHYYLVTSGETDVRVQEEARRISDANKQVGLFGVDVYSWDQLLALLQDHRRVARKHYRALQVALSEMDAPAELIAICHQSFQNGNAQFHTVDAVTAAEGFYPVQMDASMHYEAGVLDAQAAIAGQRNLFRDITAQLRAHPDATVAYFGIAHIPLTMHAGAAASTKQAIRLYELDGPSGQWEPLLDESGPDLDVELVDMGGPVGGEHAVIQVEASARVAKTDIDQTITKPYRHIVIRVAEPKRGVITHHDQARAVANAFREAVDRIHNENPATTMHVFAATPVSVSFRLGQMVSQTMHRSVLAYNYSQRSTPPYHWAVDLVAADGAPGQLWISEGQPRV
ncbi:hypothetical protein SAMN05428957_102263 [Oryzisolibacter propanilivorax]|uniref:SMODS-associated and fused to various effectors domain-containing protein n=1 Tax=Oryzisolibacter propanilivorax TaxID=1527607 RepID=A0A1G9QEG5_9BURK|nr:SAVED domain-containing protein [Oryzisolibacter propanilivorax]SDM09376.1 hypothetical protein SAMN05428957_102263 [Oryzisolibacter propanilivorax]